MCSVYWGHGSRTVWWSSDKIVTNHISRGLLNLCLLYCTMLLLHWLILWSLWVVKQEYENSFHSIFNCETDEEFLPQHFSSNVFEQDSESEITAFLSMVKEPFFDWIGLHRLLFILLIPIYLILSIFPYLQYDRRAWFSHVNDYHQFFPTAA